MYPTLLKVGSFEVTTFGLMMFLAFIIGGWVLSRQYRRYGLTDDLASSITMAAAIGGIVGAKIYYAILFRDWHLLFERAGLVWYGGLIGGVIACSWVILHNRVPYLTAADATVPALSLGYCLGRIGCFLVGDDYGAPTNSWVGIAFPKGAPPTTAASLREFGVAVDPSIPADQVLRVHPTQLYEAAAAFAMFAILMILSRKQHRRGALFALFLLMMGIERFLVEFVRAKDDRFFGPFTMAQVISVLMIIAAGFVWMRRTRGPIFMVLMLCFTMSAAGQTAPPPKPWNSSFGAGLAVTSGNSDTRNINLAFNTVFDPKTIHLFKADALYLLGEANEEKQVDKATATGRYERTVSDRLFWFGETSYLRDPFKAINYLISPIAGAGYRLIQTPTQTLAVDGGAGFAIESNRVSGRTSSGAIKSGESFDWAISPTSKLTQRLNGLWKTNDFGDALYHFDAGIATTIAARAEMKLSYVVDYKNKPPAGVDKTDTALFATIGYKW
jgi:phosphatidylglycerol---prolipoprotein diacylglyceryl transferase